MKEKSTNTPNNDTFNKEDNTQEQRDTFQDILNDQDLERLFEKHGIENPRDRKLSIYNFFWLMILSTSDPSRRGTLHQLISFFLGAIIFLSTTKVESLSKSAVSQRLSGTSWFFFRGVYNHLLSKYKKLLPKGELQLLKYFKDIFAVDGSVISLCKEVEQLFASTNKGLASLKLNTKFSIFLRVVTKLQVTKGKRHDILFKFVTKEENVLYLVDLGYWSYKLMQQIIDAGGYFVMKLKSSCDPLIVAVVGQELEHLVGRRLSEVKEWLIQSGITELDITVQLSKAKRPHFVEEIRLVGILHEEEWYFYVTNIFSADFNPSMIYKLYSLRWQVEIFFNVIKNVLNVKNIISKNKNGIMIEIYSALIMYLLTQIVIAMAARKSNQSIHNYSFELCTKLLRGFLITNLRLFFEHCCKALDMLINDLVNVVIKMGRRQSKSPVIDVGDGLVA